MNKYVQQLMTLLGAGVFDIICYDFAHLLLPASQNRPDTLSTICCKMSGSLDGGSTSGHVVRFTSLNTGGLNAALKRTKIMTYIKNLNADVMLLQETHLLRSEHGKLNRPWMGQIFQFQFNCKTRGTAVLIRKNFQFTSGNIITDPEGCYNTIPVYYISSLQSQHKSTPLIGMITASLTQYYL